MLSRQTVYTHIVLAIYILRSKTATSNGSAIQLAKTDRWNTEQIRAFCSSRADGGRTAGRIMGDVVSACSLFLLLSLVFSLALHEHPIPLLILSLFPSRFLFRRISPRSSRYPGRILRVRVQHGRAIKLGATFRWRAVTRDTIFSRRYICLRIYLSLEIYPVACGDVIKSGTLFCRARLATWMTGFLSESIVFFLQFHSYNHTIYNRKYN